jgi:hypothetical protein
MALEFASEELQNDKEVALEAIINDWDASKYVGFEIKEAIKELLKNNLK